MTTNNLSWTRPPQIAYETIHYAVEALMFDRKHALEVIREEGNGLSPEQKSAICQKIQDLKDRPKTVKDKNRLENRLIGVLQPATLRFLERPDAIAPVGFFFGSSGFYNNFCRVFAVQCTDFKLKMAIAKHEFRSKTSLEARDLFRHFRSLYSHVPENRFWRGSQFSEKLKVLLLKSKIQELVFEKFTSSERYSTFCKKVAEAIELCGKNTQFRRIVVNDRVDYSALIAACSGLLEFRSSREVSTQTIIALFSHPHLQDLDIKLFPESLVDIPASEKTSIQRLKLRIDFEYSDTFSKEAIAYLMPLSLTEFDLSGSRKGVGDEEILLLAELPHLQTIHIPNKGYISEEGIGDLLRNSSSIKTVIIEPSYVRWCVNLDSIVALQRDFPEVTFRYANGTPYPKGEVV